MSNSIAPGSSADVNVKVTALTTNPNVPVTYKTIILKKNLVNGVNTLTQEMMSVQNIKYVIKYDYMLGENIDIPNNCILEFDGGSISGAYTITGYNTCIQAGLVKILNTNITFAGTWKVAEAYPEWFGAKGDGVTDDTDAIQNAITISNTTTIFTKDYKFTEIEIYYGKRLQAMRTLIGNILISHSQNYVDINLLNGQIKIKGKDNACRYNTIRFSAIRPPQDGTGIYLDASDYGIESNSFYGGLIINQNNATYNYGIYMKAINDNGVLSSFCNENFFFHIRAVSASIASIYFNNANNNDGKALARMNGNIFYGIDPTDSTIGIVMNMNCVRNIFYALRNNEFLDKYSDKFHTLIQFGTNCLENQFYTTRSFVSQNIDYTGSRYEGDRNIIHNSFVDEEQNILWSCSTYIEGSGTGNVAIYPVGNKLEKVVELSDNAVMDNTAIGNANICNATIFKGNFVVVLNNGFSNKRYQTISTIANAGTLPTVFARSNSQGDNGFIAYCNNVKWTQTQTQGYIVAEIPIDLSSAKHNTFISIFEIGRFPNSCILNICDSNDTVLRSLNVTPYPSYYNIGTYNTAAKIQIYSASVLSEHEFKLLVLADVLDIIVPSNLTLPTQDTKYNITLATDRVCIEKAYLDEPRFYGERPTDKIAEGYSMYDNTLNKPIWYKGDGVWVDATGTTI